MITISKISEEKVDLNPRWPYEAIKDVEKLANAVQEPVIYKVVYGKNSELQRLIYSPKCFEINDLALKMLEQNMSDHDWYFDFSDDARVFREGDHQKSILKNQISKLVKRDLESAVKALFNRYCPWVKEKPDAFENFCL